MKSTTTILILIASGIIFQACQKGSMWGIKGEGENITESRSISEFNATELSLDANIIYVQDSVYSLQVSAQKNILNILETKVEGLQLKMDFRRNVWQHNPLNFVIHAPILNKISINGNGNVTVSNKISGNYLELSISGSGNISIPTVSLQSLDVKVSGSGNVNINDGNCKSEYFNISGSANINSEFLKTDNADATVSGAGNLILNAASTLNVSISGSGSVKYRGHPEIHSNINGSGKLIHLD